MNDSRDPSGAPKMPRITPRLLLLGTLGVAALVALFVFVLLRTNNLPKRARSLGARLELAAGDVTVSDPLGDVKALSGTPLAAGATVTTAKGARAMLRT